MVAEPDVLIFLDSCRLKTKHKWNNYGGVEWEDDEIAEIAHFDENIRTEFVYSYQETLLNIIGNNGINSVPDSKSVPAPISCFMRLFRRIS